MASKVVPTKSNLLNAKKSYSLAVLGHDLMDRKRNILVREMMNLIEQVKEIQAKIDDTYAQAYLALQKANITLGIVQEASQAIPIDDGLSITTHSVMGVELPKVTLAQQPISLYYGLESTNSMLDDAYLKFVEVKKLTAKLAEVESNVFRLADAIKKSQKRTNALNNIIIPRLRSTIAYISSALEEKEREDFSRLKVIKQRSNKEDA
ncbi:MAG TPA: V-type ATP synthase subunit D [Bacillota bacterium]|nr:V-type ATP synthase subunit D [Bacillota bacterium]HOK68539.1 V-type ATP synthase subunit D [Bacillota bacterium]HPP86069.1 V-type ATP synthase subunit D [Bacillota bacterium]